MILISKATPDQAECLFNIMVKATKVGCGPYYPQEVIEVWHKGRSSDGMAGVIAEGSLYSLQHQNTIRGFVHIAEAEILGLFVHPEDHRKGYGTKLFQFAMQKAKIRPVVVMATLNAVLFYTKLGCRKLRVETVRRHDRDIYVQRMEII